MQSSSRPTTMPGADSRPRPPLDLADKHASDDVAPTAAEDATNSQVVEEHAADGDQPGSLALAEAAARGDRAAFDAIIAAHRAAVFGYLRSRVLEPSDAEDLSQEVFLRFYQGRARFLELAPRAGQGGEAARQDGGTLLRGWLIGIARNLLHEHVRRVKRRKEVGWTELCLQLDSVVEQRLEQDDESLAQLPVCLQALGQSARQALDMRYQAQMRLSEIGEKLHRSEGAIKLLMFRARQALKHCLDSKKRGSLP